MSQIKPNAEPKILKNFQPGHLEEPVKGNEFARGGKKKKTAGNIDTNNKCESSGALTVFPYY